MKMKRMIAMLLVAVTTLSFAACSNDTAGSSSEAAPPESSAAEANPNPGGDSSEAGLIEPSASDSASEGPDTSGYAGEPQVYNDGNLELQIAFDKEQYTLNDLINISVKVTNVSASHIGYIQGSGSARVPDALHVNFEEFVNTHTPAAMTMDYRTEVLASGESKTYVLTYVPYTAVGEQNPGAAFDQGIEFFQTDDYAPAEAGEIGGEILFQYLVVEEEASLLNFNSEDVKILSAVFKSNLTA